MVLTLAEQESGIFVWSEHVELKLEGWFDTQSMYFAALLSRSICRSRPRGWRASPPNPTSRWRDTTVGLRWSADGAQLQP